MRGLEGEAGRLASKVTRAWKRLVIFYDGPPLGRRTQETAHQGWIPQICLFYNIVAVLLIRFWIRMDPHQLKGRMRIRIKIISWNRIHIKIQMKSQNAWNMSLFEHFLKVLSLYLEASIRIRIGFHIKVTSRIRIRIKVTSRIRIRIGIHEMTVTRKRTISSLPPYVVIIQGPGSSSCHLL